MEDASREQWGSRLGFILAAVGSAVGLGNMWRFPYVTAENGGAAFLVLYLVMVLVVGLPIMLGEFSVGRGSKKSPIEALAHFGGPGWKPLGGLFVLTGLLVLSYYAVIAGWTMRYTLAALVEGFQGVDAAGRFDRFAAGLDAVGWHLGFMALTIAIVVGGIKKGIERAALTLIPLLFLIVIGLDIYAATLEGAGAGYAYYLQPDLDALTSLDVLAAAAGQAFFSLSLGMGAMLTYSSYLSEDENLPQESLTIALSDFGIAFLAGLLVFPLMFALGLSSEVQGSTVGALFISIPGAFQTMGDAGRVVGFLFFGALFVGALTSSISLLEVVTSSAIDGLDWTRKKAALITGIGIAALGLPAAFSLDALSLVDQLAGNVFLVVGALMLSIFVGWAMDDPIGEVRKGADDVGWFPLWRQFLRWVVPALLLLVLYNSLQDTWAMITGMLG